MQLLYAYFVIQGYLIRGMQAAVKVKNHGCNLFGMRANLFLKKNVCTLHFLQCWEHCQDFPLLTIVVRAAEASCKAEKGPAHSYHAGLRLSYRPCCKARVAACGPWAARKVAGWLEQVVSVIFSTCEVRHLGWRLRGEKGRRTKHMACYGVRFSFPHNELGLKQVKTGGFVPNF